MFISFDNSDSNSHKSSSNSNSNSSGIRLIPGNSSLCSVGWNKRDVVSPLLISKRMDYCIHKFFRESLSQAEEICALHRGGSTWVRGGSPEPPRQKITRYIKGS
ncbi:hypothetical protein AABB24_019343 [Solanum stoloniferum]|uniref:Uncharacterized protein n=1 Tax=Solanum stoloniferum TaxID=62892 RepID=A0ABD2TG59_9SOLN